MRPKDEPKTARPDRPLDFIGSSKDDLSLFPQEVKLVTGYALRQIQHGKVHPSAKPMKGDLREVIEISVRDDSGHRPYRTACTTRSEAIYVLYAFQKKSTSGIHTSRHDLDLIRRRLKMARKRWEAQHGKGLR